MDTFGHITGWSNGAAMLTQGAYFAYSGDSSLLWMGCINGLLFLLFLYEWNST